MIQKIIRVGNSAAVTLPKDFLKKAGYSVGQEVAVEQKGSLGVLIIKPKNQEKNTLFDPEFKTWLDNFTAKNIRLLRKLAKTQ